MEFSKQAIDFLSFRHVHAILQHAVKCNRNVLARSCVAANKMYVPGAGAFRKINILVDANKSNLGTK